MIPRNIANRLAIKTVMVFFIVASVVSIIAPLVEFIFAAVNNRLYKSF